MIPQWIFRWDENPECQAFTLRSHIIDLDGIPGGRYKVKLRLIFWIMQCYTFKELYLRMQAHFDRCKDSRSTVLFSGVNRPGRTVAAVKEAAYAVYCNVLALTSLITTLVQSWPTYSATNTLSKPSHNFFEMLPKSSSVLLIHHFL